MSLFDKDVPLITHFPLITDLPPDAKEKAVAVFLRLLGELDTEVSKAQDEGTLLFVDAIDLRDMVKAALDNAPDYLSNADRIQARFRRVVGGAQLRMVSCGVNWKTSAPAAPDQERQGQP